MKKFTEEEAKAEIAKALMDAGALMGLEIINIHWATVTPKKKRFFCHDYKMSGKEKCKSQCDGCKEKIKL